MLQITAKVGGCVGLLVCSYWCEYSEYSLLLADWRTTGDPGDPGGLLAEKGCQGLPVDTHGAWRNPLATWRTLLADWRTRYWRLAGDLATTGGLLADFTGDLADRGTAKTDYCFLAGLLLAIT